MGLLRRAKSMHDKKRHSKQPNNEQTQTRHRTKIFQKKKANDNIQKQQKNILGNNIHMNIKTLAIGLLEILTKLDPWIYIILTILFIYETIDLIKYHSKTNRKTKGLYTSVHK